MTVDVISSESEDELALLPAGTYAAVLPDPTICRAKWSGFGDYVDCLVNCPACCPFAMSFGAGFFCRNPARAEIVKRTERLNQ